MQVMKESGKIFHLRFQIRRRGPSDTSRTLWIAVIAVSLSRVVRERRVISRGFAALSRVIHDCGHFIPFRSRSSRIGYAVCCILNRDSVSNDAQKCAKRESILRNLLELFHSLRENNLFIAVLGYVFMCSYCKMCLFYLGRRNSLLRSQMSTFELFRGASHGPPFVLPSLSR